MLVGESFLVRVSVVVCTYCEERLDYVLDCFESLKKQTLQPSEVILVLDNDKALFDFYLRGVPSDVKVVVSDGFGLSNARNFGVKNARGEIVAFIDDDAIADADWLKNLVKNYEDSNVLGVGGFIEPLWESGRPRWFPEELYWIIGCSYKGLPEGRSSVRNPIGCNMSFRREAFEKVGYFRGDLGRFGRKLIAHEDTEFSIRVLEKNPGSKIVFDPSAVVYHRVHESRTRLGYLLKRSFYEGFSKTLITDSKSNLLKTLSTEGHYLRYLLKVAIPSRLGRISRSKYFSQLLMLSLSTFLVLAGYAIGKMAKQLK